MNSNFSLRYTPNRNTDMHIKTALEIHNSIVYYGYKLETTQIDIEWINKKKMGYIHMVEHYSALIKKEILQYVTTWMELGDIMLSEINQIQKDKYYMILLT